MMLEVLAVIIVPLLVLISSDSLVHGGSVNTNECLNGGPAPCLNGGTCSDPNFTILGDVECSCPQGYLGKSCQAINECYFTANAPCSGVGNCSDPDTSKPNSILSCSCPQGYSGTACQFQNECITTSDPCQNNGTCVDPSQDFLGSILSCICLKGTSGPHCALVDECSKLGNPCQNGGTCSDPDFETLGNRVCACDATKGYSGRLCQNVDECALLGEGACLNGGVCQDSDVVHLNSYSCNCSYPPFVGDKCQYLDECATVGQNSNLQCLNGGKCLDPDYTIIGGLESLTCQCLFGFYNELNLTLPQICSLEDECETGKHLCLNGGTCVDHDLGAPNTAKCYCYDGFSGNDCSLENECITSQRTLCLHGGVCSDPNWKKPNTFVCDCSSAIGYSGNRCQKDIDACVKYPCAFENSICRDKKAPAKNNSSGRTCACLPGFEKRPGPQCVDINECIDTPCKHNGQCVNSIGGFECVCPAGFGGKYCQKKKKI